MKSRFTFALAVAGFASAFAGVSNAQIVYSNFPPGDTFLFNGAALGVDATHKLAVQFTATESLFLDYIDLRFWHGTPPAALVNVTLLSNSTGNTPGTALEASTSHYPLFSNPLSVTRADFLNQTFLTAGTSYWVAVSQGEPNSAFAWEYSAGPLGLIATGSAAPNSWDAPISHQELAIRVVGTALTTPVPEPSTYGLIGTGLMVAVVAIRRGKRA